MRYQTQKRTTAYMFHDSSFMFRGFSLVEMLLYIALLSLSLLVVLQTLIMMVRAYGNLRATQHIEKDAGFGMERIVREVRDASDITDGESVFDTYPGELFLVTSTVGGTSRTVEFYLENGRLMLKEDGVVSGALTGTKSTVTNLVFRKIATIRSKGVKIEMTVESGSGRTEKSQDFFSTAVLRDSY